MATAPLHILMVGSPAPPTSRLIFQLAMRGHVAMHADTVEEAKNLLADFPFAVVLAQETLPDGRGYDLAWLIAHQGGNLFVGVPLSETLWLPVVERGSLVLGQRALNASVFENEVEIALGAVRIQLQPEIPDSLNQRIA
jgi:hypothetical protein